MELRQLQYFLAVADNGSLSKASTVLGIAQPALSRAVRQLEDALQTQLFHRHGRGIRLTERGTQFQVSVDSVVRKLLQAGTDLRAGADIPAGSVSFGMPPSMSAVIGARLVETFLKRYPRVKLQVCVVEPGRFAAAQAMGETLQSMHSGLFLPVQGSLAQAILVESSVALTLLARHH